MVKKIVTGMKNLKNKSTLLLDAAARNTDARLNQKKYALNQLQIHAGADAEIKLAAARVILHAKTTKTVARITPNPAVIGLSFSIVLLAYFQYPMPYKTI